MCSSGDYHVIMSVIYPAGKPVQSKDERQLNFLGIKKLFYVQNATLILIYFQRLKKYVYELKKILPGSEISRQY